MRLRLTLLLIFLLLTAAVCEATPAPDCSRAKAQPDAWVASSVDTLVRVALAAYEDDDAVPAYQRVLGRITDTLERCGLARDEKFVAERREFIEYVGAAS